MRLSAEHVDAIRDLNTDQVSALKATFKLVIEHIERELLACSLSRSGDPVLERTLIVGKYQHEGAMRFETLLIQKLQELRKL